MLALLLVYFISAHDKKLQTQAKAQASADTPSSEDINQAFRQFTKFCVDLCEYLKLEITDFSYEGSNEILIKAESKNPITRVEYLVAGFHLHPSDELNASQVTNVSDQIVSERLSKGMVITTGQIPNSVKSLPELASIEFIDGEKVKELQGKIIL